MKYSYLLVVLAFSCIMLAQADYTNPLWRTLSSQYGIAKPFRYGHSASVTTFGRVVSFSGLDNTLSGVQSVSRFNYLSNSQLQVLSESAQNDRPSRISTAFDLWDDQFMTIYGGLEGGSPSNELLMFDIQSGTWLNITGFLSSANKNNDQNHYTFGTEGPCGSIDSTGDSFWLFGGRSTILQINYVTRVDLHTGEFVPITFSNTQQSDVPIARWGSHATFNNPGTPYLYIWGGRRGLGTTVVQDPEALGDGFKLNLNTFAWAPVTTSGQSGAPSPRGFAATTRLKAGNWILFGGANEVDQNNPIVYNDVYTFDFGSDTWSAVSATGTAPSPRYHLIGCNLGWTGEDSIFYYGGSDSDGGALNDFFKLEFLTSGTSPIAAPTDLDADTDNKDQNPDADYVPPLSSSNHNVTSSSSSSLVIAPPVLEDGAASALNTWISLFF